ncbi:MAG: prepilin-type N-terminal cleavage/methylation domain-containing protein [Nitrospinales bacterium]
MLKRIRSTGNEEGFTLIELLIVIAIIGILAAIAIPQFTQYKARAYNTASKSDLHNLYLACKAYWADNASNDNCTITKATESTYGLVQTSNVTLAITTGTETAFAATASHASSTTSYSIDSAGNVT